MDLTAYAGGRFRIDYAVLSGGSSPAKEFYDSLEPQDQARLMALFMRLADEGRIWNREHFKKVEGTEYFEFKRFQIRMLCRFQSEKRVLLVHGFKKKQDRIPKSELERADRIFSEYSRRRRQ